VPDDRQRPPSVDALARSLIGTGLPAPLLVDAAREAIERGEPDLAEELARRRSRSLLRHVVNATGVLLHTNLGRAPLEVDPLRGASNLELDLESGRRGSRQAHAGALVARLCGAESAIVVNNGAAAVLLVLAALAAGREVVVSRGESVEIGGGFRVPDVMAQSGARLVDVGTTNRTNAGDYRAAIERSGADVALVLKVHASNFTIEGFTAAAPVASLGDLGPPVVVDHGSGLVDAACPWLPGGPPSWLSGEPAARQTLAAGAALVTFSGDKLFAGPQAGVIAGRADLVERCARHPLARALRPGGLVLAALQETAMSYLRRDVAAIPFWRMASVPQPALRARAARLGVGEMVDMDAVPGAGSTPGRTIPSAGIVLDGDLLTRLRAHEPPVIGRVTGGRTWLDLRTVDPADDVAVAFAARSAIGG
jgi:L-seryl-tRNA(Ser) seleniumtransferase